ncbi:MAG: hypothetical protein J6Q78_05070, partial [Clostridia bacterium]|nr:hypothetical protein [Clostridia bacterium]
KNKVISCPTNSKKHKLDNHNVENRAIFGSVFIFYSDFSTAVFETRRTHVRLTSRRTALLA